MSLPTITAYSQAMQHPEACLRGMAGRTLSTLCSPRGRPLIFSGNFVATFKLLVDGNPWAVRCYHREAPDAERRIQALQPFLAQVPASLRSALLAVHFIADGIQVEGAPHPVVLMAWSDATPLRTWVAKHLGQPEAFRSLLGRFLRLVGDLERMGACHGDLQAGNLLVGGDGSLVLVDYDSFTVPQTRHLALKCFGHRSFQHPGFDPARHAAVVDRMPALVLAAALMALGHRPDLWARFGKDGEGLLFEPEDLARPQDSPLFRELRQNAALLPWAERLAFQLGRPPEALSALPVLIIPGETGGLPGLGQPVQRENLARLLNRSSRNPGLPIPAGLESSTGSLAKPAQLPANGNRAATKPPRSRMALMALSAALLAAWWLLGPGKALRHLPPEHPGTQLSMAPANPKLRGLREDLRRYLEVHNPHEVETILREFDQQTAGLDPNAPGFQDRLNHILLRTHGRSS